MRSTRGNRERRFLVQDLASRFADGRLSTEKLIKATDEDLFELLIAVKGVGKVCSIPCYSLRLN